jgi:hypothetical protein
LPRLFDSLAEHSKSGAVNDNTVRRFNFSHFAYQTEIPVQTEEVDPNIRTIQMIHGHTSFRIVSISIYDAFARTGFLDVANRGHLRAAVNAILGRDPNDVDASIKDLYDNAELPPFDGDTKFGVRTGGGFNFMAPRNAAGVYIFNSAAVDGSLFAAGGYPTGDVEGAREVARVVSGNNAEAKASPSKFLRAVARSYEAGKTKAESINEALAELKAAPNSDIEALGSASDPEVWKMLIKQKANLPVGFYHWRIIETDAGSATFYIQGEATGFTMLHSVRTDEQTDARSFRTTFYFRFKPGVVITHPENVYHVANVVPVNYLNGATTEPFKWTVHDVGNFKADLALNPGLVTYMVGYKETPKHMFLNLTGVMNGSYYTGPETSDESPMFSTGPTYRDRLGLDNKQDFYVPLDGDLSAPLIARTRMLADVTSFVTSHGIHPLDYKVEGSCPMGPEFELSVYKKLSGSSVNARMGKFGNSLIFSPH